MSAGRSCAGVPDPRPVDPRSQTLLRPRQQQQTSDMRHRTQDLSLLCMLYTSDIKHQTPDMASLRRQISDTTPNPRPQVCRSLPEVTHGPTS